jgi:hypothetical protein
VFASATLIGCDQGRLPDKEPASDPASAPRVHGRVTDTAGAPLVGVGVKVQGKQVYTTTTDARGRFELKKLDPDTYLIVFLYTKYENGSDRFGTHNQTVVVTAGSDQRLDIQLAIQTNVPAMPYGAPPSRRRTV